MRKVKWKFIISFFIIISFLTGCFYSEYSEGETETKKAWELMTVKEKQIYDIVEEIWGQKILSPLREGVRSRSTKPEEETIPFFELGAIIKTTEEVQMLSGSDWGSERIKRHNTAKFSSIDQRWYRQITKPRVDDEIRNYVINFSEPKVQQLNKFSEADKLDASRLITIEEYDNLKWQMRSCLAAQNLLETIVASRRPLTISDRDKLIKRILYCKAEELNKSLKE